MSVNRGLFETCYAYCRQKGYELPVGGGVKEELKFAKDHGRDWRFDAAWVGCRIAFEFQGLPSWSKSGLKSRHFSVAGMSNDAIKHAAAQILGWKLYAMTTKQAEQGLHYAVMDFHLGDGDIDKVMKALEANSRYYRAKSKARSKADVYDHQPDDEADLLRRAVRRGRVRRPKEG